MKSVRLLIRNAFRSAKQTIGEIIGLSLLIFLVSLIISLIFSMSSSIFRADDALRKNSNLRDAVVQIDNSKQVNISDSSLGEKYFDDLKESSQELYQEAIINELAAVYNFNWTRTEGRTFSELQNDSQSILIKAVAKFGTGKNIDRADSISSSVDKMLITDGNNFSTDVNESSHQVVLQKTFAEKNKIKIGDIIRMQKDSNEQGDQLVVTKNSTIKNNLDKELNGSHWYSFSKENPNSVGYRATQYANAFWFEVVGFGVSSDFMMPVIDQTTTLPNIKKDMIAYVDPNVFGFGKANQVNKNIFSYSAADAKLQLVSNYDREVYFSIKSNTNEKLNLKKINRDYSAMAGFKLDQKIIFDTNDSDYQYVSRIKTFKSIANIYNIIVAVLLLIVAGIAVITIILITVKHVESVQKQMGTFKAIGYHRITLLGNFVAIPLITSAIGCVVGYLANLGLAIVILHQFQNYFNIDFGGITFNFWSFIGSIIICFVFICFISFLAVFVVLRKKPLQLLSGNAEKRVNFISKIVKKSTIGNSFNARLRGALISSSVGKIVAMVFTIFLSTILLSMTVMAPKIMQDNMKATFNGLNYSTSVEYTTPVWNNPLSFYRTFNQTYDASGEAASDGWGMNNSDNSEKGNVKVLQTPFADEYKGNSYLGVSTLPYNKANDDLDVNKIVSNIIDNKISSYYYSYDKTDVAANGSGMLNMSASSYSKLAFEGWKTMSTQFLSSLNNVEIDDSQIGLVIPTLSVQWPDYVKLLGGAVGYYNSDMLQNEHNPKAMFETLQLFYKKYANGLPLKYLVDDTDDVATNYINMIGGTDDKGKHIAKGFAKTQQGTDENKNKIYLDLSEVTSEKYYDSLKIKNNSEFTFTFEGETIDLNTFVSDKNTSEEFYKELNTELARWIYGTILNKIGTIILETGYSRAPYFVQQKLFDALKNNSQYSISFNVAPYDSKVDDIGTMLTGTYKQKNGSESDLKIYGLDQDQKTIDLGVDFSALQSNYENVKPIVINETLAKKYGVTKGSNINISYDDQEIQKVGADGQVHSACLSTETNCDDEFVTNVGMEDPTFKYTPESGMAYYSKKGSYYGGTQAVTSATVAGNKMAGANAQSSTKITDSLKSVDNGQTFISTTSKPITFKVVGIQKSFGKAQAWTTNDVANKLLHYDVTEKYLYQKFFRPQFLNTLNESNESVDRFNNFVLPETLDELITNSATDSESSDALKMFHNLYPVFNYKNSIDKTMYDIDQTLITSQSYGDYSASGLNGGNEIDAKGNITKYYAGLGQGGTKTIYPITQARQILEQITDIVNLVIIMFIILALAVSLTIILVTVNIIIRENVSFIATMKILGYSNRNITTHILRMYIGGIVFAFIAGYLAAWFGTVALGNMLAMKSSWVLPISFYWWYPFAIMAIIVGIYAITISIGWYNIQKVSPLVALQYQK